MFRQKKRIYKGFYITAAAWLLYFFSTGASSYGTGIVSTRIVLERGWDQSIIGLSSSMLYLAVTVSSVLVSMAEKAKGIRTVIMTGAVLGMAAYAILMIFSDSPVIYVAAFLLLGICSASCGMITGPALITAWHRENRAAHMSVFYTSGAIAGFLMPLAANALSEISVQLCWGVFFFEAFLALLLGAFVTAEKPEEKAAQEVPARGKKAGAQREPNLAGCYRSGRFYSLFFQTFVCRMSHTGIISYITIYAVQKGIVFSLAAVLVTVYSVANFCGRCLIGVSSRLPFDRKTVNLAGFLFISAGSVILPFADTFAVIAACVMLVGLGAGMSFTIFSLLVSDCFGDENFMILNGVYNTLGTAGSVVSPVILLAVAELTGAYETAYTLIAVLALSALLLAAVTPIRMLEQKQHCGA